MAYDERRISKNKKRKKKKEEEEEAINVAVAGDKRLSLVAAKIASE